MFTDSKSVCELKIIPRIYIFTKFENKYINSKTKIKDLKNICEFGNWFKN